MTTLQRYAPTITWVSLGVIVLALLSLTSSLPLDRVGSMLITWVDGLGLWAPIVFPVLYVAATILFVPVVVLTLVAGGIFGLWLGTLIVSLASTLSAAVTFLIARYLAREQVSHWVQRKPQRRALEQAIGQGGWKLVVLLRLSTVLPFSLQNYLFGLTPIGFCPYLISSWLAMLPGTFIYVYVGHATRAAASDMRDRTTAEWVGLGVGLIATMAAGIYISAVAKKKLREQTALQKRGCETAAVEQDDTERPSTTKAKWPWGTTVAVIVAMVAAGAAAYVRFNPDMVARMCG